MLLHAREIPACLEAFRALDIDQAWFRGYTESEASLQIAAFIERTDYENYIIASDDLVPTQGALSAVQRFLGAYEVVTGWSNISPAVQRANVLPNPLSLEYKAASAIRTKVVRAVSLLHLEGVYRNQKFQINSTLGVFPTVQETWTSPEVFRTYYVGWSFTGMRKAVWQRFPFGVKRDRLWQADVNSDWWFTRRANEAGVRMMCARDGFFYHLKSMENFIVGKVPKEVIFHEAHQP